MVLRPEHELEKEYWLWLDEVLTPDDSRLAQCLSGVPMLGGIGRASRVTVVHAHEHTTELCLGLREGKNRQIRRICTALDLRLVHLHRKSIGPVTLDGIPPGSFRILTSAEVDALSLAAGGRNAVEARRLGALVALARAERAAGTPHARLERWLDEAKVEVASERTKASPQALSLG
jgi:hypothetical protein